MKWSWPALFCKILTQCGAVGAWSLCTPAWWQLKFICYCLLFFVIAANLLLLFQHNIRLWLKWFLHLPPQWRYLCPGRCRQKTHCLSSSPAWEECWDLYSIFNFIFFLLFCILCGLKASQRLCICNINSNSGQRGCIALEDDIQEWIQKQIKIKIQRRKNSKCKKLFAKIIQIFCGGELHLDVSSDICIFDWTFLQRIRCIEQDAKPREIQIWFGLDTAALSTHCNIVLHIGTSQI